MALSEDTLLHFEKTWSDYKNDDRYNDFGKLNLVSCLGERAGLMLDEIRRLKEIENKVLQLFGSNWEDELKRLEEASREL
jgi:hypothetical protein